MPSDVEDGCRAASLNALMGLEPRLRATLRHRLSHLLRAEGGFVTARADSAQVLVAQGDVEMLLPARVGDYTDFYASVYHATNVGKMLRPDNPLLPNYKWVPIGYHGRASSLVASGTPVPRPSGQTEGPGGGPRRLRPQPQPRLRARGRGLRRDPGNALGSPVPLAEAEERDLRAVPRERLVGPRHPEVGVPAARSLPLQELRHLGRPWVVTLEALAPYRVPAFSRPEGDPRPLPYLAQMRTRRTAGST